RLRALEDAADIGTGEAIAVRRVAAIAHQPAGLDILTPRIARRYAVMRRPLRQLHAPAHEQCAAADEECIGRSCSKLANAASMSRSVPTLRTRICNPIACAPACTSCNVLSVLVAWAGLTSTANRLAVGTIAHSSSSRFATSSVKRKLIPVRLLLG